MLKVWLSGNADHAADKADRARLRGRERVRRRPGQVNRKLAPAN
jgi:hypothetical protein